MIFYFTGDAVLSYMQDVRFDARACCEQGRLRQREVQRTPPALQVRASLLLLLLLLPFLLGSFTSRLIVRVLGFGVEFLLCLHLTDLLVQILVVVRVLFLGVARHPVEHHKPLPASDWHDLVQILREEDGERACLALKLVDDLGPRVCDKVPAWHAASDVDNACES